MGEIIAVCLFVIAIALIIAFAIKRKKSDAKAATRDADAWSHYEAERDRIGKEFSEAITPESDKYNELYLKNDVVIKAQQERYQLGTIPERAWLEAENQAAEAKYEAAVQAANEARGRRFGGWTKAAHEAALVAAKGELDAARDKNVHAYWDLTASIMSEVNGIIQEKMAENAAAHAEYLAATQERRAQYELDMQKALADYNSARRG